MHRTLDFRGATASSLYDSTSHLYLQITVDLINTVRNKNNVTNNINKSCDLLQFYNYSFNKNNYVYR